MSALAIVHSADETTNREVLEFECGVRAYAPATTDGSWRLRWIERGHRRDTTARSRAKAIARAEELVERLSQGTRTELARAKGVDLVAHYLDPARRPPRGRPWSERHREEQEAYCRRLRDPGGRAAGVPRYGSGRPPGRARRGRDPVGGGPPARCLSALVTAGLEEGYLLARQDVLRGVRWKGEASESVEEIGRAISAAEIPTASAVHALAQAAAEITGVWWRELEVLLVAYSGLRWGEHAALTADRIEAPLRSITVDRQVLETRHGLKLSAPKGRKRRITMYPARTPEGISLAELVARRLRELSPDALLFPSPRGRWVRRSGYGRRIFRPAAEAAGWPQDAHGRLCWTFHSLRHVFATWALAQPGARLEDVSRLLGHSSVRITQDVYISPDGDLYDRFYRATE